MDLIGGVVLIFLVMRFIARLGCLDRVWTHESMIRASQKVKDRGLSSIPDFLRLAYTRLAGFRHRIRPSPSTVVRVGW